MPPGGGLTPGDPSAVPNVPYGRQAVAAAWATELARSNPQAWNQLCEVFVEEAYGQGQNLGKPRYGSARAAGDALLGAGAGAGPLGSNEAIRASLAQAKPGDLLFFVADDTNQGNGHVGIYLGNGMMVSATPQGVKQESITGSAYWSGHYRGSAPPPAEWAGRAADTAAVVNGAQKFQAQITAAQSQATGGRPVADNSNLTKMAAERDRLEAQISALQNQVKSGPPKPTGDDVADMAARKAYDNANADLAKLSDDYRAILTNIATVEGRTPSATEQSLADANLSKAQLQVDELKRQAAAIADPTSPERRQIEADIADKESLIAARRASTVLAAQKGTSEIAQSDAETKRIIALIEPTVRQVTSGAGLNEAQTKSILDQLPGIIAERGASIDYTKAKTAEIAAMLAPNIRKAGASAGLDEVTAERVSKLLAGEVAAQGANLKRTEAETGQTVAQTGLIGEQTRAAKAAADAAARSAAWQQRITTAIAQGATPEQIDALVQSGIQDVNDYVALQGQQLQAARDAEAARHNAAGETLQAGTLAEQQRSNQAAEGQKRAELQTARLNQAQALTSQIVGGNMFTTGGPVRPGQTTVNLPTIEGGDPNDSIGTQLMKKLGLWDVPTGPAAKPVILPPPPAAAAPAAGGTGSAAAKPPPQQVVLPPAAALTERVAATKALLPGPEGQNQFTMGDGRAVGGTSTPAPAPASAFGAALAQSQALGASAADQGMARVGASSPTETPYAALAAGLQDAANRRQRAGL